MTADTRALSTTARIADALTVVAPPVPSQITIINGPAEAFDGDIIHGIGCFHRRWRVELGAATAAYGAAIEAMSARLSKKQRQSPEWFALDEAQGLYQSALMDHLVDVLATHFPGLAGAIRAVAWHDDSWDGAGGGECCDSLGESADDPRTTALRFAHEHVRRSIRMDVDLDRVLSPLSKTDRKEVLHTLGELMEHVDANWPASASVGSVVPTRRADKTA